MKNINNNYFTANKIDTEKIVYGFFSKNGGYSLENFILLIVTLTRETMIN